jgi:negative regulator of flagellin synthesis FlgM
MKIIQKGPADTDLSQVIQKDQTVESARGESAAKAAHASASAKVEISDKARQLQRIAELARMGDQLRAEKVRELKEQIAAGQYQVDAEEIAKSILRSDVSSLIEKK